MRSKEVLALIKKYSFFEENDLNKYELDRDEEVTSIEFSAEAGRSHECCINMDGGSTIKIYKSTGLSKFDKLILYVISIYSVISSSAWERGTLFPLCFLFCTMSQNVLLPSAVPCVEIPGSVGTGSQCSCRAASPSVRQVEAAPAHPLQCRGQGKNSSLTGKGRLSSRLTLAGLRQENSVLMV